ncbi:MULTISPECIES: lipopolysaccharide biosynthesis protein [unclassified Arsenophonus]|uniref:lipopolysaccharide biosynthesis protein n=1 Tax=unclassified Arsenophonus TaxID=2627083 RepID=UPI00285BC835|nr:oligosaccharide flippase family protein [Arsenophonus sp.]MDR5609624.1 oligosaccharide flippase family protein [Arsenophonus sp.]
MIRKIVPQTEFARNVVTLMTGTTIAQAIPIAISPLLTRIYTPKDFGVLALFISIIAILGSIANARYELAIMLPEKDEDAINIFALGFIINCTLSLFFMLLAIGFNDYFTELLDNEEIGFWLYFVPLSVFFIGLFNLLNYFNNRRKNYKDLKNAVIIKSIFLAVIQLSIGLVKTGASGLISGQIISNFFANTKLLVNILKDKKLVAKISKNKIIFLAKRYITFPKYSVLAILFNNLSQHLISILISSLFNIITLGFYSLVQRVLGMPSTLIGSSIGQVFFQQASQEKQKTGLAIKSFNSAVKKLLIIGMPLFVFIYLTVEPLFIFVFAEEWRVAGYYAKLICPLFFIRFVVSTVSPIDTVMEKQNIYLLFNIVLLITSLAIIYISHNELFEVFLVRYSMIISIIYILYGFLLRYMAKGKLKALR